MNGFALIGVAGSLDGVSLTDVYTNLVVLNGTIRDWGNAGANSGTARNSQFEHLRVLRSGGAGLQTGADCLVKDCIVKGSLYDGFVGGAGSVEAGKEWPRPGRCRMRGCRMPGGATGGAVSRWL